MLFLFRISALALTALPCALSVAQTGPDEGDLNDLTHYDSYGPVTATAVATSDGTCGDAFRLELEALQDGPFDAGFQVVETAAHDDLGGKRWTFSFRYRADAERPVSFLLNSRRDGTYGDGGDHTYAVTDLTAGPDWATYTADVTSVRSASEPDWHFYTL